MSKNSIRLITLVVIVMIFMAIGLFALPRAVQALPGRYLVRLQSHPLTGNIVEAVTTPMATALPVSDSERRAPTVSELPDIPGLDQEGIVVGDVSRAAGAEAPAVAPTPTRETVVISVGETATPEATGAPPTPTQTPTPTVTPEPLPEQVLLEDVPVEQQLFNNCGPANMTIALNFWGEETTQQEAASYLKPNQEDRNVSPWQINDYVNEFTSLKSTAHASGNLEMVKRLLAAGFLVVVEKGFEPEQGSEGWYGHYLTVYGYDDAKREIYSRDTYLGPWDGGPRIDGYEEFLKWWQQFYYTFYVIYPPQREAEVRAIIPDVLEEDFSMWQYTADIARAELEEEPDNVFTWFNLGVALTRMGQVATSNNEQYYQEATQAFDKARDLGLPPRALYYEHRPLMAYYKTGRVNDVLDLTTAMLETSGGKWVEEIYWYRGHALAATGDLYGAVDAYENALEVNPNFYYAQWSLDYVTGLIEE